MLSTATRKYAAVWIAAAISVVLGLSLIFGIPYIYSIVGVAGLMFGGHFVTLDDDAPGGWSNPDGSKDLWHSSLKVALLKLMVVVALVVMMIAFPDLARFGAR